jgi:hypothetical protein
MSITIDLPNEIYERLQKQAQTRGKTIAETLEQVLAEVETSRRAAVIEQMRAEGKILPKQPLPPGYQREYKRIEVQGKPVSECIIEERR